MFLPIIFFVAFALYVCITITLVVLLIYNHKKSKYPDLKEMKYGVDYFTQPQDDVPRMASTIDFWLETNPNKKVITILPEKSKVFVVSASSKTHKTFKFDELGKLYKDSTLNVYAPTHDIQYLFQMLLYVFNIKIKYNFVEPKEAHIKCEMKNINNTHRKEEKKVSYKNVIINRVNFFLPFARFVNNQNDDLFLVIDYLIYDTGPFLSKYKKYITENDLNNFYQLYFPFYRTLENFEEKELFFIIDKPIHNLQMLVNKYDDLRIMKFPVQFYPELVKGDKVSIINQVSSSENGTFYVQRIDLDWIYVQSYKYIYNFYDHFILTRKTDNGLTGERKQKSKEREFQKVWFIDLDLPGTVQDNVALVWKNKGSENSYHCIPDNTFKTKESCESKLDALGNPKPFNIWDKQCSKNTDCPFYNNHGRGGCDNGYCEMPIGITRIGYTRYALGENSFPYCHQCKGFDSNCCFHQSKPDYAFPFDYSSSLMS